jgi:hypothetical protein
MKNTQTALVKIGIFITYRNFGVNLKELLFIMVLGHLVPVKNRFCTKPVGYYLINQNYTMFGNKKTRDLFTGF